MLYSRFGEMRMESFRIVGQVLVKMNVIFGDFTLTVVRAAFESLGL